MHGHQDSDHYDVQFSTRQLVLLFGLLVVIVVGVFVGGIVIGRGMAPSGAEALVARGVSPAPARPAPATPARARREAPTGERLRLPIPPDSRAPRPAAAPARSAAAPVEAPVVPPRPAPIPTPSSRAASTSPDQLSNRTLAAPRRPAAPAPAPSRADRPTASPAAGDATFTIQVAAFRDRAAAERMLKELAERGIEGYLEGTPAGIFRVRVGQFESREAARALAARLEGEQFATLITGR